MTPEPSDGRLGAALIRSHQTRVRLLSAGWRVFEVQTADGFEVGVSHREHNGIGDTFQRPFYSDALDAALRYASHAQARIDAGELP